MFSLYGRGIVFMIRESPAALMITPTLSGTLHVYKKRSV